MGADIILATLTYHRDTELSEAAGLAAITALTTEQLDAIRDEQEHRFTEDVAADGTAVMADDDTVRDALRVAVADVFLEYNREITVVAAPGGYRMMITGGMSWGDDPTESYEHFALLNAAPTVRDAIGFVSAEW